MTKLKLNKRTIQTLNKEQMQQIDGGLCLISCASGSRKEKACCDRAPQELTIDAEWGAGGPKIKIGA